MSDVTAAAAGEVAPPPADDETAEQSFALFPIAIEIREALSELGYDKPTAVQTAVIEPAMAGHDLVVQAKTGSGKTAAFGIPLVEKIVAGSGEPGCPLALVLTPTRELALQVAEELYNLSKRKETKLLAVYGGVPMGKQIAGLKVGVDIIVGTPGRLLDHIRRGNLSLSALRMVVLDEADEMLSMGFWDDVTDLLRMSPDSRQTMLFSATLPYQIARAAAEFLKQPTRLDLSGDILTVAEIDNCIVHVVPDIPKPRQLLYILETEQPESAIIFCNTRNEAEMIAKYLTQSGFVAEALTGNFKQRDRERVMQRIKAGDLRFMVATDVAARGIDIDDLSHVILYSLPEFSEVYVHRVGRTGRIGKLGTAISLVDGKGLGTLSVLEREFNISFTEKTLPDEQDVLKRRSERIMKDLSEKASVAEVGQHLSVAEEIIGSTDGAQVVAFLLKSYFSVRAVDSDRHSSSGSNGSGNGEQSRRQVASDNSDNQDPARRGRRRRSRRGRRPRRPNEGQDAVAEGESTNGAAFDNPSNSDPVDLGDTGETTVASTDVSVDRMKHLRVNIGFEDGFKGRGAVAKKISALAGLNDGIIQEVESRRDYAVLKATPEIAELVVERVDGAQVGKKTITVQVTN